MNDTNRNDEALPLDTIGGGNEVSYNAGLQIGAAFGSMYQAAVNATADAMCAVHEFVTGQEL
jgi:hypothetical protein